MADIEHVSADGLPSWLHDPDPHAVLRRAEAFLAAGRARQARMVRDADVDELVAMVTDLATRLRLNLAEGRR